MPIHIVFSFIDVFLQSLARLNARLSVGQYTHHLLDDVLCHAPQLVVLLLGHLPAVELALQLLHGIPLEILDVLEQGGREVSLPSLAGVSAAYRLTKGIRHCPYPPLFSGPSQAVSDALPEYPPAGRG